MTGDTKDIMSFATNSVEKMFQCHVIAAYKVSIDDAGSICFIKTMKPRLLNTQRGIGPPARMRGML